ncbi:sugar transport protein 8-like [Camellia sinensis]|uniref:sugar transport protein 8-like n=1 Tax=Camellia sinensis TaxID=4442 RepID=UPI0010364250|nr:sugar transport protein 8-like [Camellia sinensis]
MANAEVFKSKITVYVVACWIVAAFGGLMFGYDIGISGGVTAMDDFLIKFFPKVHERKLHAKEDNYCKYDDQLLQLFTSSLYLAALVASFGASKACRIFGRKPTILVASLFFIGGAGFSALAEHKWMLILGRILFGIGVGFGNECSVVSISASSKWTSAGIPYSSLKAAKAAGKRGVIVSGSAIAQNELDLSSVMDCAKPPRSLRSGALSAPDLHCLSGKLKNSEETKGH